jgi:hypothetical protein
MQISHEVASLEQRTDVENAAVVHYLDPEFNAEAIGEDDGTVLGSFIRSAGPS